MGGQSPILYFNFDYFVKGYAINIFGSGVLGNHRLAVYAEFGANDDISGLFGRRLLCYMSPISLSGWIICGILNPAVVIPQQFPSGKVNQ